jgi:DNA-binding CsgD family transcriptional regulator
MSLEEKLGQIRTLLAQRDRIDEQLEAIIGHYGAKPPADNTDAIAKKLNREALAGHMPKATGRKDENDTPNKNRYSGGDARRNEEIMQALLKGKKPREVAKQFKVSVPTVYNIKARSKTVHAQAQRATREAQAEPEVRPVSKELSTDQYDALRRVMFDRHFSSAEYALTVKLSPREVNTAIRSADYDDYLAIR